MSEPVETVAADKPVPAPPAQVAPLEPLPPLAPLEAPLARRSDWLTYGDAMRVLGAMAVLVVHTCDMVLFSDQVGTAHWWAANVADATGRWAVPVFIMLSGALLLRPSRPQTPGDFYRRRLARLGVAILFWSAAFMLFSLYVTQWNVATWRDQTFGGYQHASIWRLLLRGQPYVHMHFVFRLGGLYLITPLLRVYVQHAPLRLRAMMAGLIMLLGMGDSAASVLLHTVDAQPPDGDYNAFSMMWAFLGFYLGGEVLRQVRVTRRLAAWSAVGYVVCVAVMAFGTGMVVNPGVKLHAFPHTDMALYDFLNPLRVGMSVFMWFILAYVFERIPEGRPIQRWMKVLAPLTLGVYLVHPLFREMLYIYCGQFGWPSYWVGVPAALVVITACSWGMTYGLSKIPYVRRIVG